MRRRFFRGILVLMAAGAAWSLSGCSTADVNKETIASVNGEDIRVQELRELLGVRGEGATAAAIPVATKREALDRLLSWHLMAMEARSTGLDNSVDFRNIVKQNEQRLLIDALFRKELASKLKISKGEIKDEAAKLMKADKALSEDNANIRAGRSVSNAKLRKIQDDLVAAAKKENPVKVNQAEVDKIGKGQKVADNAALATVGPQAVTYGEVKALLGGESGRAQGGQDPSTDLVAVGRALDQAATGRSLVAFAKKQGIEGSEWMKAARADMERSILADLLAMKEVLGKVEVTDKEIADAYAEHGQMFVQKGKKIPLSGVKEKLREYLAQGKQRKALDSYTAGLKAKAKITVKEELLPKV